MVRVALCFLLFFTAAVLPLNAQVFQQLVWANTFSGADNNNSMQAQLLQKITICESLSAKNRHIDMETHSLCYEQILDNDCNWAYLPDSIYVKLLVRIATYNSEAYQKAKFTYFAQLASYFIARYYGNDSAEMAAYYQWRGSSAIFWEHPEEAMAFLDRSINIYSRLKGKLPIDSFYDLELAISYISIGDLLLFQKKWPESQYYYYKAADLLREADLIYEYPLYWCKIQLGIGQLQVQRGQYELAKEALNEVLYFVTIVDEPQYTFNPVIATTLSFLAEVHTAEKNYDKAIPLYDLSSQYIQAYHAGDLWHTLHVLSGSTHAYRGKGAFARAEQYLATGLENWHCRWGSNQLSASPKLLAEYGQVLMARATNYRAWYTHTCADTLLYQAHRWSQRALGYLSHAFQLSNKSLAQNAMLRNHYALFEEAINIGYLLYEHTDSAHYVQEALRWTEFIKNIQLQKELKKELPTEAKGIPPALLEREHSLRELLSNLRFRKLNIKGGSRAQGPAEIVDSIEALQQLHQGLLDSLHTYYPAYFEVQQPFDGQDIAKQMQKLAPDHSIVTYFVSEDYLFSFVTRNGQSLVVRQEFSRDTLQEVVNAYSLYVSDIPTQMGLNPKYLAQGQVLYDRLIRPIRPWLSNRLLILPDDELVFLPFEALPTRISAEGHPIYLIEHYSMSYAYSLLVLQRQIQDDVAPKKLGLLAFAPNFWQQGVAIETRHIPVTNLRGAAYEVGYVSDLYPSLLVKGEQATRSTFEQLAPDYQVIHLATHAESNSEESDLSYLAFSQTPQDPQSRLYAHELSSMQFEADMVVLSACGTAHGQWDRGYGPLGLARAFTLGGARSTITTLWSVSDRESAQLMTSFYSWLAEGQPKDDALRAAKLKFLAYRSQLRAHPYYWSGYIAQGNMNTLELPTRRDTWLALGILVGFCLAIWVGYQNSSWLHHKLSMKW